MSPSRLLRQLPAHVVASGLALSLAEIVWRTSYMTSAMQFVSPLAVILMVHLVWLSLSSEIKPGFALIALTRMLATAVFIAATTIMAAIFAPIPAAADSASGRFVGLGSEVLVCLAIVAVVLLVAGGLVVAAVLIVHLLIRALQRIFRWETDPNDNRKFDFGAIAVAFLAIGVASQEGVSPALTFATAGRVSSTVITDAPLDRMWQAIGTATSPDFPLPAVLRVIPRPVGIVVDEGSAQGARRIVRFVGREGEGNLELRVTRRTENEAVFTVEADRSPIANWVTEKALTFRVEPSAEGTRLTVVLDYDRRLSPAWFFGPYIRLATFIATDVLARDTAERAAAYTR
jgi:hypothetical protein